MEIDFEEVIRGGTKQKGEMLAPIWVTQAQKRWFERLLSHIDRRANGLKIRQSDGFCLMQTVCNETDPELFAYQERIEE